MRSSDTVKDVGDLENSFSHQKKKVSILTLDRKEVLWRKDEKNNSQVR